jgi:hypothetical protein
MLTDENTIIELHSEECVCRGYGWVARRKGSQSRSECCRKVRGMRPEGAVWVDSDLWLALGLPRTTEQYLRARLDKRTLRGGCSQ